MTSPFASFCVIAKDAIFVDASAESDVTEKAASVVAVIEAAVVVSPV